MRYINDPKLTLSYLKIALKSLKTFTKCVKVQNNKLHWTVECTRERPHAYANQFFGVHNVNLLI